MKPGVLAPPSPRALARPALFFAWAALAALMPVPAPAGPPPGSVPVIDQQQTGWNTRNGFQSHQTLYGPFGQSFVPTVPWLDFFDAYFLDYGSGSALVGADLFSGIGFTGPLLYSLTKMIPDDLSGDDPTRFMFPTLTVVPGQDYTFRVSHLAGNPLMISGAYGNPYSNGQGFPFTGYDLQFATGYFKPIPKSAPATTRAAGKRTPLPYTLVDQGAILSALTTGLMMPGALRHHVHQTGSGAYGDLNDRLFRARAGYGVFDDGFGPAPGWNACPFMNCPLLNCPLFNCPCFNYFTGGSPETASLVRFLDFAGDQHIDYRVALGLAEGEIVEYDLLASGGSTLWGGHPMALAGGSALIPFTVKAVVAVPEGAGKETIGSKVVVDDQSGPRRFELFTEFDYGFFDQDSLTSVMNGFDTDSYSGIVGLEYRLAQQFMLGTAFSHLWSDTELASGLGGIDSEGTLLAAYFTWFWRQFYLDTLYTYGNINTATARDTLLGSSARGDTDSDTHTVAVNLGMNHRLTDQITTGPHAALIHSTGEIDGYTERGGGTANLVYPDDNFAAMLGRLGWHVTHQTRTGIGRLTTQLTAGWAHEFMPEDDPVQATLVNSPYVRVTPTSPVTATARRIGGFTAQGTGAYAGEDWLELGAGLRLDLDNDWSVSMSYEGQFARDDASAHFGTLKLSREWGDHLFAP